MKVAPVESSLEGSFELALHELRFGESPRERGLNDDHVRALAELGGSWLPIVVWGPDNLVVDGAHRVAAARRLGLRTVHATRFAGTCDEAFIEGIRLNVTHGLPLTIGERLTAAQGVLQRQPQWSDRRISVVCGLSAKTVARMRRARDAESTARPQARVGRDGRNRPVQPAEVRTRILDALLRHPEGSLRCIAAEVGASPETVRSVRKSLGRGTAPPDPAMAPRSPAVSPPVGVSLHLVPSADPPQWGRDPAFASTQPGQDFAAWFETSSVGDDWRRYLNAVPLSRVYEVADEARSRATVWSRFAQTLEGRIKGQGSMRA